MKDEDITQYSERDLIEILLAVMYDFVRDADDIVSFLDHIGFDITAIDVPSELLEALPAFYRSKPGHYDVPRLEQDLVSWEPVAAGIEKARRETGRDKDGV